MEKRRKMRLIELQKKSKSKSKNRKFQPKQQSINDLIKTCYFDHNGKVIKKDGASVRADSLPGLIKRPFKFDLKQEFDTEKPQFYSSLYKIVNTSKSVKGGVKIPANYKKEGKAQIFDTSLADLQERMLMNSSLSLSHNVKMINQDGERFGKPPEGQEATFNSFNQTQGTPYIIFDPALCSK